MTQKHTVHGHEISEHGLFVNISIKALVIIGIGLIIIVAIILAYIWPVTESSLEVSTASLVPYTHALEMQYAKPWLDAMNSPATVVEYTNALELVYSQPWLGKQKISATMPKYSNALETEYAKPWLGTPSSIEYNNALELLYANPWLIDSKFNICHSRMDYAYACRNGGWIPEK